MHPAQPAKGILAIILIALATIAVWIPLTWWIIRRLFSRGERLSRLQKKMDKIILWWTGHNRWMIRTLGITQPEIIWQKQDSQEDNQQDKQQDNQEDSQEDKLSVDNWYMVISNHQSWTDILLLQSYLYGVIPPLKFFTKEQLIWVPGVGLAMYVLGFPYVKRATKAQIKANPKLRNADRESIAAACEGFKNHPTSILNFVEGTRCTPEKQRRQGNEYKHLLRPKIGGLDYVLEDMQDHLHKLLDVTIIYPDGVPTFWHFLQGGCKRVIIEVTPYDIPFAELAAAQNNRRTNLAQWIKTIWVAKDMRLSQQMDTPAAAGSATDLHAQTPDKTSTV